MMKLMIPPSLAKLSTSSVTVNTGEFFRALRIWGNPAFARRAGEKDLAFLHLFDAPASLDLQPPALDHLPLEGLQRSRHGLFVKKTQGYGGSVIRKGSRRPLDEFGKVVQEGGLDLTRLLNLSRGCLSH